MRSRPVKPGLQIKLISFSSLGIIAVPTKLISPNKIFNNKIRIIGVGGVDSGKSAYEKFISGASYIQLYTGMVYQGPNIVNKISEELNDILTSNGVKNIEEIIGSK